MVLLLSINASYVRAFLCKSLLDWLLAYFTSDSFMSIFWSSFFVSIAFSLWLYAAVVGFSGFAVYVL